MTAPAPTLLSRTAAPVPVRDAAPRAVVSGAERADRPGFAAHLAREVPRPAPAPARPARREPAPSQAKETPVLAEAPGKPLPPRRQKLAGAPALPAAPAESPVTADPASPAPAAEQPAEAAAPTATATLTALAFAVLPAAAPPAPLPVAAPVAGAPQNPATPSLRQAVSTAEAGRPGSDGTAPQGTALQGTATLQAAAPQAGHPAAFAPGQLLLEREGQLPASEATPPEAARAGEGAARAQPSTLAALTGAPDPDRTALRKARSDAGSRDTGGKAPALPALSPDTAGAPQLAQPPLATASASAQAAPPASGPQPMNFDQLVDSIARARDGIEPAGPVAVAMHHQEFGRISLRIESDGASLAVAMASADPAFAPAAAAAHAAAMTSAEPPRPAQAPAAEPRAAAQGQSQGQSQGQGLGQGHSGAGQQHQGGSAPRPAANPGRPTSTSARHRSGIFA